MTLLSGHCMSIMGKTHCCLLLYSRQKIMKAYLFLSSWGGMPGLSSKYLESKQPARADDCAAVISFVCTNVTSPSMVLIPNFYIE